MAVVTRYGFVETAKLMTGETATAWESIAVGTGSKADSTTLQSLASEIADSGLARVACSSVGVASSVTADDTCVFIHTWTAEASSAVMECGVFNSDTANTGDMLCYGTFSGPISMESDDTLKVTWSVQVTAGA